MLKLHKIHRIAPIILKAVPHLVHQITLQAVPVNLVLMIVEVEVVVHHQVVVQNQVREVVKSNSRY